MHIIQLLVAVVREKEDLEHLLHLQMGQEHGVHGVILVEMLLGQVETVLDKVLAVAVVLVLVVILLMGPMVAMAVLVDMFRLFQMLLV